MRELYKTNGHVEGWDAQHEAARRELAEATDCINELLYVNRQLEWLVDESVEEMQDARRVILQQLDVIQSLRLQRAILISAVCWVVAWWLL